MPVAPNTPKPLATALQEMESTVQSTKSSMAFAAPEMFDMFWAQMQMDLAESMAALYETMTTDVVERYNRMRAFAVSYADWHVTADLNRLDTEVKSLLQETPKLD
jgi:hypothetical protein